MTPEIQNQIIGAFWGILPIILIFMIGGAVLGLIYKMLMKKAEKIGKEKKENKNEKK